jgi:hypothetical protein
MKENHESSSLKTCPLYKDKRQFIKENLRILNAEKKWPCLVVKPER